MNNPVMNIDENGYWPQLYNWQKIAIGAAVITVLVVATVATGGAAAGVAGYIAASALNGALIGAASGAAIGAGIGAVSHRLSSGSWEGAGQAALDGAADGFMTGAVTGAVMGGVSGATKVSNAAKAWDKGTFNSSFDSMRYHYKQHVIKQGFSKGNYIVNYTDDAVSFMNNNSTYLKYSYSSKYNMVRWTHSNFSGGGLFTTSGKIISYWYKG